MITEGILFPSIPLTSETVKNVRNQTIGFITLENHGESARIASDYINGDKKAAGISYMTNIVDYLGIVRNESLRLILVTNDDRIGHKAAVLAASYHKYHHGGVVLMDVLKDSDGEISFSAHDETSQENAEEEEKKVIGQAPVVIDDIYQMPYIDFNNSTPMSTEVLNQMDKPCDSVGFWGLDSDDILHQVNEIRGCEIRNRIVVVSERLIDDPQIKDLIYEEGFDVIHLDHVGREYYRKVLDQILDQISGAVDSGEISRDELLYRVMQERGTNICEESFATVLEGAVRDKLDEDKEGNHDADTKPPKLPLKLKNRHFKSLELGRHRAKEKLAMMVGLDSIKKIAAEYTALSLEAKRNPKARVASKSMLFVGGPGTGKTTLGELLAQYAAEEDAGSGAYVCATRKDLIGTHVGETAPKVKKAFDQARGGILFVDEAGFFLQHGTGGFVEEAIKEFVRYMESDRETTVIVALYNGEQEAFLQMDNGLASRVGDTVLFPDYTDDQLLQIFKQIIKEKGYRLKGNVDSEVTDYIGKVRKHLGNQFGNAREMRGLADAVVKTVALRNYKLHSVRNPDTVNKADVKTAIDRQLHDKFMVREEKNVIGFGR